jgi:membrane protein insertase Oxa1/YidC/SpoIIIJ
MEVISHGAHMHEMLWDIGNEYRKIKANPPKVCLTTTPFYLQGIIFITFFRMLDVSQGIYKAYHIFVFCTLIDHT